MVAVRMRIRPHCTIDLRDNSSVGIASYPGPLPGYEASSTVADSSIVESKYNHKNALLIAR